MSREALCNLEGDVKRLEISVFDTGNISVVYLIIQIFLFYPKTIIINSFAVVKRIKALWFEKISIIDRHLAEL